MTQDWAEIDGQVLIEARGRKGLSREAFGAIVGVVAKTVERYENKGRVPRHLLPRFAAALDLEVEEVPSPVKVRVEAPRDDAAEISPDTDSRLVLLEGQVGEILDLAQEIRDLLEPPKGRRVGGGGRA